MADDIRALAGALANLGRTLVQLPEALDRIAAIDAQIASRQRTLDDLIVKTSTADAKLVEARMARETLLSAAEKTRADAATEAKQIVAAALIEAAGTKANAKAKAQEALVKAEDKAKELAAENVRLTTGLEFLKTEYAAMEAKVIEAQKTIATAEAVAAVMKG